MAVAIMALAEVMDANGVEEHGAADQMNVQDHLIVQYSKVLKKIEDQSHALDTGTIDDEVQYTVLESEMNISSLIRRVMRSNSSKLRRSCIYVILLRRTRPQQILVEVMIGFTRLLRRLNNNSI